MDIKEVMQRKYGPMPVWAWTALVGSFIAGIMIFRKRMGPSTPTTQGGTSGGPAGEFNSGLSTTTTDAQGNQTTSNYSASGPLTGYPGYLTTQAGAMPFQQGDVYVNTTTPPPATTTNSNPNPDKRTVLNADKFNENGWSATARQSPWTMAVSQLKSDGTPETWKDITARIYGFAKDYASISDTTNKARVDQVATYIRDTNKNYTGEVPDGSGPTPGSVVVYR